MIYLGLDVSERLPPATTEAANRSRGNVGGGSAKAARPANAHYAGQPVNALAGKTVLRVFVVAQPFNETARNRLTV